MRDFIIIFSGGEGSSAIICHLKQFTSKIDTIGFEPFDSFHLKKKIPDDDLNRIFSLIFAKGRKESYQEGIQTIFKKYSDKIINKFDKNKSVGFKMRYREWDSIKEQIIKNNVVVFVLMRRNILKWGLSKCAPNSLQFRLAQNKLKEPHRMNVNIGQLKSKILQCQKLLKEKEQLIDRIRKEYEHVHPLYYENYCNNKVSFFRDVFNKLDIKITPEELVKIANKKNYYKKVHSENISDFVINYKEVEQFIKQENLSKYI